jgi:hypothetical protein
VHQKEIVMLVKVEVTVKQKVGMLSQDHLIFFIVKEKQEQTDPLIIEQQRWEGIRKDFGANNLL